MTGNWCLIIDARSFMRQVLRPAVRNGMTQSIYSSVIYTQRSGIKCPLAQTQSPKQTVREQIVSSLDDCTRIKRGVKIMEGDVRAAGK